MGNITRQIVQGIVQGEKLEQVAQRLTKVADMNIDSARTHAQTAMGAAQNAGRLESYRRTQRQTGYTVEQEWIATLDGYTREAHGKLDGQRKPVGEPFEVTHKGRTYKIMYPCDPAAAPCMVYNCRCTTGAWLPDFPDENAKRRDDDPNRVPIKDMTFTEWMAAKNSLNSAREDAIIEAKKLVASDAVSKTVNVEKQNRHVRSSPGYIPGRSCIFGDAQTAQELVNDYSGKGEPKISRSGKWNNRESVVADVNIGVCIDPNTGEETRTNRFTIHYSKTGVHIVPADRRD